MCIFADTTFTIGTWIPLPDGKDLAVKNGVYEKLRPIFDYVPGDRSPPPAPKHATAASAKPRAPRAPAQPRRQPVHSQVQPDYDAMDTSMRDEQTPDNATAVSESAYRDYDNSQYINSHKRRRVEDPMSQADKEHQLWADDLLDYFMLQDSATDGMPPAPAPPATANLNRPIDDKGHTALHWAAAMGDIEVVKDLVRRGANIDVQSKNGETPLMRAVIFTNSHDRQNMDKLAGLLIRTVNMQEWFGNTVFHHIANTTQRKSKYLCARYYVDCLLNKMAEILSPDQVEQILNRTDQNGDTAITIAARYGARKCVRSLMGRNAAVDIVNTVGETADQLIVQLNQRRQERVHHGRQLSSSPFQADGGNPTLGGAVQPPAFSSNGIPFDPLVPHSSINGGSSSNLNGTAEFYKSDAALAITSNIMPTVFTKVKTLASTLDAEIAEKDAELAEAERVLAIRRAEIETLKKRADEIRIKEMAQMNGVDGEFESDDALEQELAELENECRVLTEQEEALALRKLLNQEISKSQHDTDPADEQEEETLLHTKLTQARLLGTFLRERKELVDQMVQHLSVAGLGDGEIRKEQYMRLLAGALSLGMEHVEALLPEVVAELEEWKGLEGVGV